MKPQLTIAHEGTLGDEDRTRFSFHEESIAHIMRVLTDLYENPELAVIREYSTNARDAHISAGKADVPIEVRLPTPLESTFVVRDEGLGLSRQEIEDNLTKYGYSSKRDTDAEVGMLGLGSKSALTYTSQFTYVACKDGKTVTVLITREDDGAPVLQVIDEVDTPEAPNFVEVHVPVKNAEMFANAARQFFWHWEPGTVKINGALHDGGIWSDEYANELWLSDDVVLMQVQRYGQSTATVVMGGVPYRLAHDQAPDVIQNLAGYNLYAFVDVGTVDFTPSRESLQMSKRTKECIRELDEFVGERLFKALQDKLNSMTYKEANDWGRDRQQLCRAMWARGLVLKSRGKMLSFDHSMPIPRDCKPPGGTPWQINLNRPRWNGADRADTTDYIHFSRPPLLIIHGYKNSSGVPGDVKDAIRAHADKLGIKRNNGYYEQALLIYKPLDSDVMDAIGNPPQVAFSEVYTKERIKRASAKAIETRYRMAKWGAPNGWENVHELDYRPDCYVSADSFRRGDVAERVLDLARAGHRVAVVWGRNKKWFEENHGDVPTTRDYAKWWVEVKVPEIISQMGDIARHRIHSCGSDACTRLGNIASRLEHSYESIEDDELREAMRVITLSKRPSPSVDKILGSQRAMRRYGFDRDIRVSSTVCRQARDLVDRFPILELIQPSSIYSVGQHEFVRILNAAYAPPQPSTDLVLWNDPSNPNNPHFNKALNQLGACNEMITRKNQECEVERIVAHFARHEGVLL